MKKYGDIMKEVYISNINDYILVDDEDYENIMQYKWHINKNYRSTRALGFVKGKKVTLPHFITGVNHAYQKVKNLDFRRNNIGIDKHKYRYRKPQSNASSQYKGVRRMKMNSGNYTWISTIYVNGKSVHLGTFDTEIEAGLAYNHAIIEYWDGNGYMNDI